MIKTILFTPEGNYLGFKTRAIKDPERYVNERDVTPEQFATKEGLRLVDGKVTFSLALSNQFLGAVLSEYVTKLLDETAVQMGYTNALTLLSFAEDDTYVLFQNEARHFRRWRTLVTLKLRELKVASQASGEILPSVDAFFKLLPPLNLEALFATPATDTPEA